MSERGNPGRVERFEQKVVFRVARGYFLVLAAAAVLAVLVGIGAIGASALRSPPPPPPEPPAEPAPAPLTLDEVRRWIADQKVREEDEAAAAADALAARTKTDDRQSEREARQAEVTRLLEELKALLPAPTYAWQDVQETYCRTPSPYGCVETGRRVTKKGIVNRLVAALDEVPGEEAIPALRTLVALLGAAPVEERGALLEPIVGSYAASQAAWRDRLAATERKAAEERAKWEAEAASVTASKTVMAAAGGYGAVGGLALLILVSLFLAHFAIERHLRLLQGLLEATRPQAAQTRQEEGELRVAGE